MKLALHPLVCAGAVNWRYLYPHGTQVDRELSAMVDLIQQKAPRHLYENCIPFASHEQKPLTFSSVQLFRRLELKIATKPEDADMNVKGSMVFRTLGRTGLKVSPLALGAMTFGWGADKNTSRRLFETYRNAGGNFIDTADLYAGGTSEEWLGEMIQESRSRDEIVLATKFSFNAQKGNPNAGGNGRKNIYRALEGSLRRLRTDFIDLYILHAWDQVTPVEEVAATLNDLVRSGKIRHAGLSDVPAWYASRFTAIADLRGWERPATLQLEYSLVSRSLEREHMPMARELGISITPWSPLASGFLSGKFRRVDGKITGSGRVMDMKDSGNPTLEKFAKREQNWKILESLLNVAEGLGRSPAEVALAWVMGRPCVTSTLIGATRVEQLEKNLAAANAVLPDEAVSALGEISAPEPNELDHFFGDVLQGMIHGGTRVQRLASD